MTNQISDSKYCSVLLVEDNPPDASLIRKALEEHGVEGELTVINDGERAIQFIQGVNGEESKAPDLVILDLNLPKKSGMEVLFSIRNSDHCREIPVLVLTSSDARQDRADAERLGASRYICKPMRLDEFLSLGAVFKEFLTQVPG